MPDAYPLSHEKRNCTIAHICFCDSIVTLFQAHSFNLVIIIIFIPP